LSTAEVSKRDAVSGDAERPRVAVDLTVEVDDGGV
jgi:hypothetical protein